MAMRGGSDIRISSLRRGDIVIIVTVQKVVDGRDWIRFRTKARQSRL